MEILSESLDWLHDNAGLTALLVASSLLLLVVSLWIGHWYLTTIPADYFVTDHKRFASLRSSRPVLWWTLMIGKNLLGLVFLLAGLVMFFTPGQGVLTVLMGLALMDFPGKQRLERWILQRPAVLKVVNRLRERANRSPLEFS